MIFYHKNLEELFNKRKFEEVNPLMALQLFRRISGDDIYLLNLNPLILKPSDFIITHIPVPPVCIRPMVQVSAGVTNEDDLTIRIAEIININDLILKDIEDGVEPAKY